MLKQSSKVDVGVVGSWSSSQSGPMIWVDHVTGHYRLTLGGTFGNYLDSGRTPAVGQWQHVAATYDGTTARIYVDGVADGEHDLHRRTSATPTPGGSAPTARPPAGFFDGLVDNVRIYDRALSPSEIQLDMASRIQPELHPSDRHRQDARRTARPAVNVGSLGDGDVQRGACGRARSTTLDVPAEGCGRARPSRRR